MSMSHRRNVRLVLAFLLGTVVLACSGTQQATVLEAGAPITRETKLTEAIGIETLGGVFTRLIEPGRAVPAESKEVFSTAANNQDAIKISVLRGVAAMARDNHLVATFEIYGIAPAPRGTPQIEVKIGVSAAGDITVAATDLVSGSRKPVRILAKAGV
jgi:molecular chaperone DnaK